MRRPTESRVLDHVQVTAQRTQPRGARRGEACRAIPVAARVASPATNINFSGEPGRHPRHVVFEQTRQFIRIERFDEMMIESRGG